LLFETDLIHDYQVKMEKWNYDVYRRSNKMCYLNNSVSRQSSLNAETHDCDVCILVYVLFVVGWTLKSKRIRTVIKNGTEVSNTLSVL